MSTHHAQLLRKKNATVAEALAIYDNTLCEVYPLCQPNIGISDVRTIIEQANLRPALGQFRLVVVICDTITSEAQQALLKILEEPPETTRFLFVLPPDLSLLKTVASRFEVISGKEDKREDASTEFSEFLAAKYPGRLLSIVKKLEDKESPYLKEMRSGLAHYVAKNGFALKTQREMALFLLDRIGSRGASNKLLLEALALLLPIGQKNKEMIH